MSSIVRSGSKRAQAARPTKHRQTGRKPATRGSEVVVVDAQGRVALRTSRQRINEALNRAIASGDHG